MRTTLRIDDDVLSAAKILAEQRGVSVGRALSDLARKGLEPSASLRYENDLPVFEVREGAPIFGPDQVGDALEDDG
ncbi:MAG: antitoxin [Thermoanaerobaculia bacterium]|nr:antitoxin [Thermoanaerobaculia bacterium]